MKTSIKTTIVVAALALLSTGAFAANTNYAPKDTVVTGGEISATLAYNSNTCEVNIDIVNASEGSSIVTVYDADGKVVLSDKFALYLNDVKKSYLMTDLEAGNYTIEVISNNKTVKQGVVLSDDDTYEKYYSL